MTLTVGRPVKILVLVLVLAGVGGIASLQLLGKSSAGASGNAPLSVAQIRARAHGATTAPTSTTASHHATSTTPAPAKRRPAPVRTTPPARKPPVTVAKNGLPIVLADALRAHRIVVVSVFDPQSQTDSVSYAEARAGAAGANAGFLGVDVLDDSVAGPLTAALPGGGLLPLPGLLIYRAPGTLVELIDGFADKDAVASLALEARTAPAYTAPAPTPTTLAPLGSTPAPAPTSTDTTTTP